MSTVVRGEWTLRERQSRRLPPLIATVLKHSNGEKEENQCKPLMGGATMKVNYTFVLEVTTIQHVKLLNMLGVAVDLLSAVCVTYLRLWHLSLPEYCVTMRDYSSRLSVAVAAVTLALLLQLPVTAAKSRRRAHHAPGADASLWAGGGRPSRHDRVGDYGNIAIWPLPADARQIGNAHINPSTFSIVVPSSDPFLLEVKTRRAILLVMRSLHM